jgi:hypothetical protein
MKIGDCIGLTASNGKKCKPGGASNIWIQLLVCRKQSLAVGDMVKPAASLWEENNVLPYLKQVREENDIHCPNISG